MFTNRKTTILVVDDDEKITQVLKVRLKAAGYEALTASNGVEGLQLAVSARPDVAILDICMPMGSGPAMAYRLRESAPDVPVIFLTASKDEGLRGVARELGAVAILEKPYEFSNLKAAIERALTERTAPEKSPEAAAPAMEGRNGKRILIIEDDRKIAQVLAFRIKSAGYEAILAGDALTGVNAAVKHSPDLVLLDISMPAGNGFTVAERIQSLVPTLTPIIFLTASKQPGLRARARELGAAGYFEKPYAAEDLLRAIKKILQ